MNKVIGELQKNSREVLRVSFTEYNGQELIDLRVWARTPTGVEVPTRKGVSIQRSLVFDLLTVLQDAGKAIGGQDGQSALS